LLHRGQFGLFVPDKIDTEEYKQNAHAYLQYELVIMLV